MDERVRRTLETYEEHAAAYAEVTANATGEEVGLAALRRAFLPALAGEAAVTDALDSLGDESRDTGSPAGGDTASFDGRRVLDAGCGAGRETRAFREAGLDVVGFDLSASLLAEASERTAGAALVQADMRSLPFEPGRFDGLWACASLHHVPREDASESLAAFERVLADGGVALLTVKRAGTTGGTEGRFGGERHFERYEPAELRRRIGDAGFDAVGVAGTDSWVVALARTD